MRSLAAYLPMIWSGCSWRHLHLEYWAGGESVCAISRHPVVLSSVSMVSFVSLSIGVGRVRSVIPSLVYDPDGVG